jgi:hypothetical protein
MTTEPVTLPAPPVHPNPDRPDVTPPSVSASDERLASGLVAVVTLLFGGVLMLGFGAAWAAMFYPPESLAVAGFVFSLAVSLAAFVGAVVEFVRAARWRHRGVV